MDDSNSRIQALGDEADLVGFDLTRLLARTARIDHIYLRIFAALFCCIGVTSLTDASLISFTGTLMLCVASVAVAGAFSCWWLSEHYANRRQRARAELRRKLDEAEKFVADGVVIVDKIRLSAGETSLTKQKFSRLAAIVRDFYDEVDRH